ncbi:MAG TPA: hypothetical protein VNZ01_14920 [Solirubrobacteraceae bacterium]|nr:hypothetical protein [Solirubrobacteraceae bacterium]
MAADARATPTARMSAAFTPERLGAPTTVSFAFRVHDGGGPPAPLAGIQLSYPRGLGLATSGLGVAACTQSELEVSGPAACPPNSHMGTGSALVELRIGPTLVHETVTLTLLAGPSPDGYLHLLVYALGELPVYAAVVLTAVLLPEHLSIVVPPIPSLPEAPYVSLAQMHLTVGGHLTYYETVNGRQVPYHPAGIGVPNSCPHAGFPFAAHFSFLDGARASARTAVACPRHR